MTMTTRIDIPKPFPPFAPIEAILPHRGTMLLLDSIGALSEESLRAHAFVRSDAWYADAEGAMPAWIGIELMAQAIAAHVALSAMRRGATARPGVLLGSQRYEALRPSFAGGSRLVVSATQLLQSDAGHGAYECAIAIDDACCAQAVVKVFQPTDFRSFIEGSVSS
jgi:predicted hotdog family 3-hydroxylacyl-ACP dehydratase